MKQFLISLLGTLAALWITGIMITAGFVLLIISLAVSATSHKPVAVPAHSALYLKLEGVISERPTDADLQGLLWGDGETSMGLDEIVGAIDHAATNDKIEGIFIDCKGVNAGVASLQSVRQALQRFKDKSPKKWILAYGDTYSQGDYFVASAADSVFLNPVGQIDLHGLSAQTMYFKELLDKVGVEMQVVKVGTYKSAVEPYLLNDISEANRQQQQLFLGNIWLSLSDSIASSRHVTGGYIRSLADKFIFAQDTKLYVKQHLVNKLMYRHEIDEKLQNLLNNEEPNLVTPQDYCTSHDVMQVNGGKEADIAVVYASGDITEDGKGGIASTDYVPLLLDLAKKDEVDAVVLRVNSGGGSAFASEQIWEAVGQYKKITGKPVYVSMGDYAASGGYYISCGADKIFAQSGTLTGSIGIFGMIPNIQGLTRDKLGINTATVATSAAGSFPNIFEPMTPLQASAMQGYVDRGYELFTSRVAQGRHIKQDSVKLIAEGRVWDGVQAKKLGLVDQIGDLQATLKALAKHLGVDSYSIIPYPALQREWWQVALSLTDDAKEAVLNHELGQAREFYNTVRDIKQSSTLQCHMDYVRLL